MFGPNALMSKLDLSDALRHILSTLVIDVMSDSSTRTGTCSLRLVSGVRRRRFFLNLLTVFHIEWRSVALTPFGTTLMIFGHVPLPPKRRFLFES